MTLVAYGSATKWGSSPETLSHSSHASNRVVFGLRDLTPEHIIKENKNQAPQSWVWLTSTAPGLKKADAEKSGV